jgi:predicted transcriptional regulator
MLVNMLPALEIISDRRRKLGLTQSQLADLAGVSQSYIAKLEAGKIEPSYLKVKSILEALDRLEKKREVSAVEIMNRNVDSVKIDTSVHEAIELMRRHGYSQLPIIHENNQVGSISERRLLDYILSNEGEFNPKHRQVSEIMEESFPQVGEDAPLSLLSSLLKYYSAVLVQKKGDIIGIITKADLLDIIS